MAREDAKGPLQSHGIDVSGLRTTDLDSPEQQAKDRADTLKGLSVESPLQRNRLDALNERQQDNLDVLISTIAKKHGTRAVPSYIWTFANHSVFLFARELLNESLPGAKRREDELCEALSKCLKIIDDRRERLGYANGSPVDKTFKAARKLIEEKRCTVPPADYECTRGAGHEGPCAAKPVETLNVANEWADAACNSVTWLQNIRDGISTPAQALEEMEANIARIRSQTNLHEPKEGAGKLRQSALIQYHLRKVVQTYEKSSGLQPVSKAIEEASKYLKSQGIGESKARIASDEMQDAFENSDFYFKGESPAERALNWKIWVAAWKSAKHMGLSFEAWVESIPSDEWESYGVVEAARAGWTGSRQAVGSDKGLEGFLDWYILIPIPTLAGLGRREAAHAAWLAARVEQ